MSDVNVPVIGGPNDSPFYPGDRRSIQIRVVVPNGGLTPPNKPVLVVDDAAIATGTSIDALDPLDFTARVYVAAGNPGSTTVHVTEDGADAQSADFGVLVTARPNDYIVVNGLSIMPAPLPAAMPA